MEEPSAKKHYLPCVIYLDDDDATFLWWFEELDHGDVKKMRCMVKCNSKFVGHPLSTLFTGVLKSMQPHSRLCFAG
jgi:hypothetical protein